MCALGEHRAPTGSAGLGQSTVGDHVWSETAHNPARQSSMMGEGMKKVTDCVCFVSMNLCVGTGDCLVSVSKFFFIFSLHSLHSVWSYYARCFHRLFSQELGNDCTHSCGTRACKSAGCIILYPPYTILLCLQLKWSVPCFVFLTATMFSC